MGTTKGTGQEMPRNKDIKGTNTDKVTTNETKKYREARKGRGGEGKRWGQKRGGRLGLVRRKVCDIGTTEGGGKK